MFQKIDLPVRELQPYVRFSDPQTIDDLLDLARQLRHLRFVHMNSTAVGGGVAEILQSLVPFMRSLDLEVDWFVITPPQSFFETTKRIHNLLQGEQGTLTQGELDAYLHYFDRAAAELKASGIWTDIWFLHDPQLLPMAAHITRTPHHLAFWTCHIDLSTPNRQVLRALWPSTSSYDGFIFSRSSYVPRALDHGQVHVIPPAIDPATLKNTPLPYTEAQSLVARFAIDPERPLVTQVSRFDVWKDPWGVIDAYRSAKDSFPDLQLALLGLIQAVDDPEGRAVTESVLEYAGEDPDIHVIWDPQTLADPVDLVVNAFQVASQVVIQKSTREGFGLTVTEAMWKGTTVVGGDAGGIRDQIRDEVNGFLVSSSNECAQRLVQLLRDPSLRKDMGEQARESVRLKYLLPRFLRDYLRAVQAHL